MVLKVIGSNPIICPPKYKKFNTGSIPVVNIHMSEQHSIRNFKFCHPCNKRYASFYKMCIKLPTLRCKLIYTEMPTNHDWYDENGKFRYLLSSPFDPTVESAFYIMYSRREHLYRFGHGVFKVGIIRRLNQERKWDGPHSFDRFILILRYKPRFVQFLPHVGIQFKSWLKKPSSSAVGYVNGSKGKDGYYFEWYYNPYNKFFWHNN